MNDELKNKSGKVKVMYVRSDDDSDKRTHNPRTGKGGGRPAKSRTDGGQSPMVVLAVKVLLTLKFCVASVRKRRASTVKTPARRYSRAVLTPSCAHGLSKA